jgi:hypothetical protein
LINGDNVQLWQERAEQRHIHQRLPREKIDRAVACDAGEWRIEITLVIHRQNHRTCLNHTLPMNYPKAKTYSTDQAREMVTEPVVGIHGSKR